MIPFMVVSPDIRRISESPSSSRILISLSPSLLVISRIYISLCCIKSSTSCRLSSKVWSICFLREKSSSTMQPKNLFNLSVQARTRLILNY